MTSYDNVEKRRAQLAQMLAKPVTSIREIALALQIDYDTVQNDIRWIKKQTRPWLFGVAREGYAYDCKMALDKLSLLKQNSKR